MAKRKLDFVTRLTREDVAGLVEALVEGLKDGVLKVQKSGETLALEVPRVVDLEIEAAISDERAEFAIEVSWRTNRAENPDTAPGGGDERVCSGEEDERAREMLVRAARQLDVSAKKAAGTMKKVATAKKKTTAGAKSKSPGAKPRTTNKKNK
jgi:amphi-Trp domain-containing protein